jgi:hypothetical protein
MTCLRSTSQHCKKPFRLLLVLTVLLALGQSAFCQAADKKIPGPREPLTARDTGTYGGWNEHWFQDNIPYNFFVAQAVMTSKGTLYWHGQDTTASGDKSEWNRWLKRARAKGYRVIADVGCVTGPDDAYDIENLGQAVENFLKLVDGENLYAITLSEENVFWNGHTEALKKAYEYAKTKTNIPIYQWYSPRASAPGFGAWPHLPADGWMVDEYAHPGPSFEELMRGFSAHQVPVVQIVWGSPAMTTFNWETQGEPAFDWQLAVCRKYNIPTAFFMWEGRQGTWGWDPNAMPPTRNIYQRTVNWSEQSKHIDLKSYAAQWDDFPALQPVALSYTADGTATFGEDFTTGGGLLAKGAVRRGFRDIRWSGGPLEFRPREKGTSSAVLQYPIESELPLKEFKVLVNGRTNARLRGEISVSASADGLTWAPEQMVKGAEPLTFTLTGAQFQNCKALTLRITMKGTVSKVGDVPAAVSSFAVTGKVVLPAVREITLRTAAGSVSKWSIVPSGSQLFTADIDNKKQIVTSSSSIGMLCAPNEPNKVSIRQKFVVPNGIDLRKLTFHSYADEKNYGAVNSLGISLDGKTILQEKETAGLDDNSPKVTMELPDEDRFKNVKEFWLHLSMRSDMTRLTTNEIKYLAVEGVGSKPVATASNAQ